MLLLLILHSQMAQPEGKAKTQRQKAKPKGIAKRQSQKAKPKGKARKPFTLSIILNSAGKVKRAPSMARMDMNMSSKKSSPHKLLTPAIVLVCPACNQNRPVAIATACQPTKQGTDRQTDRHTDRQTSRHPSSPLSTQACQSEKADSRDG